MEKSKEGHHGRGICNSFAFTNPNPDWYASIELRLLSSEILRLRGDLIFDGECHCAIDLSLLEAPFFIRSWLSFQSLCRTAFMSR